jgi:hypothetical protein
MNPIPLHSEDGRIFAYACGICHHVHASGHRMAAHNATDIIEVAELYREMAARCCTCRRCGVRLEEYGARSCEACKAIEDAEQAQRTVAAQKQDVVSSVILDQALTKALDREAADVLRDEMSDISEECYCAGWLHGLESDLWLMLQGGRSRDYGQSTVSHEQLGRLRDLHEKCGGWWYWHEEHGHMFATTAEWMERYVVRN